MKFILNKDKFEISEKEDLTSGSISYYEIPVETDEEWKGLDIEAVIIEANAEKGVGKAVINNKVFIDRTISGNYLIGFRGYKIKNNEKTYQISTKLKQIKFKRGAGEVELQNDEDLPSLSEWEIYISEIRDMITQAQTSATTATTQAGIATAKANEASISATNAQTSAENAEESVERAEQIIDNYEDNIENKITAFNSNAENKSALFNNNAIEKTNSFNSNVTEKTSEFNSNAQEKLNTYNENTASKIANYNNNAIEKLQDYNDNAEEKVTEFNNHLKSQYYTKEEIEKVIDKKEVEGTEIHIEDAKEFNMIELEIEGKSEQKSRSGKNKFDLSKVYVSNQTALNETGITLKNAWGTTVMSNTELLKDFKTNTAYKVTAKAKVISKPTTLAPAQSVNPVLLSMYKNSSTPAVHIANMNTVEWTVGNTYNIEQTFTTPENLEGYQILGYTFYGNNDGSTTYAENGEIEITDLMIREATITDDTFELYGASPSPEFPSPIENVEGWNKFDKNSVTNGYYLNESGNLVASANYCVSDFIEVEEGEKYFIPKRNTSRTKYYLSDKTAYSNTWDVSDYAQVITIPVGVKYIRFSILISGNDAVDLNTFQFIKGSEEKPYAPYNSLILNDVGKNIIPFPYYDKRTAINGVEVEVKNDGSIILNGTATATGYFHLIYNDNIELQAGDYYLSGLTSGSISTYYLQSFINGKSGLAQTTTPQKYIILEGDILDRISLFFLKNTVFNNLVIKPQFEYGQSTDYEPYKYQVAYFPLAEGQKLMQGSYISDTGIHHKRKQIELEGTENWIALNKTYYMPVSDKRSNKELGKNSLLSNQFKQTEYMVDTIVISKGFITETYYITGNKNVFFNYDDGVGGVDNWKAYLAEQYANGTPVILEYELAEPVTEPFTAEQQTAWNNVKAMKLFEGVNNITVNATIKPNIRFKYAQDLKKRIEKIEQAIVAIGGVE